MEQRLCAARFLWHISISAVSRVTDPSEAFSLFTSQKRHLSLAAVGCLYGRKTKETTEARRMTAFCLVSVMGVNLLYLVYQLFTARETKTPVPAHIGEHTTQVSLCVEDARQSLVSSKQKYRASLTGYYSYWID